VPVAHVALAYSKSVEGAQTGQILYSQQIGRGLRIDPNPNTTKKDCLVLDFTDQHNNLKTVVSLGDIIPSATIISDEMPKGKMRTTLASGEQKIRSDRNIDEEFNILGRPKYVWISIEGEWSLSDDNKNEIVIYEKGDGFVASIFFHDNTVLPIVKEPRRFEQCKETCEEFAEKRLIITYADYHSAWMLTNKHVEPSSQQISFLKNHNAYRSSMSKAEASTAIRRIIAESKRQYRKRFAQKIHVPKAFNNNVYIQSDTNSRST